MRRAVAGLLSVGLGAAPAIAQDFVEQRQQVTVRVGQTVEVEVGFAMGHLCDDETIVRGEMRNKSADTNVFAITGLKAGTTLCRAGTVTVEHRPTVLFEITVTAPPVKKPAPPARHR